MKNCKHIGIWTMFVIFVIACQPALAQGGAGKGLMRLGARLARTESALNAAAKASLERSVQRSLATAQAQQLTQPTQLLRSVFHARGTAGVEGAMSGTVFKTMYNGQEEVYGVISSRSIIEKLTDDGLGKTFMADVYTEKGIVSVPVEVVEVGAPGMLGIALVKFRPEDEKLFTPLDISQQALSTQETLGIQGFVNGKMVYIPTALSGKSTLSLRARVPGTSKSRLGLCGAPIVNAQNQLVGIYTGSISLDGEGGMAYATRATFLTNLVAAYHQAGNGTFPLELDGKKIMDLQVDEYIPEVEFFDAAGQKLFHLKFKHKFSYGDVKSIISTFEPRYIDFTVSRVSWGKRLQTPVLVEKREAKIDPQRITYRYDVKENKIVSQTNQATFTNVMKNAVKRWLPGGAQKESRW